MYNETETLRIMNLMSNGNQNIGEAFLQHFACDDITFLVES